MSFTRPRLKIAFLWHFHQPWYKNPSTGYFELPWTRLHALKDYYQMIKILDDFPEIKLNFNFSGVLLEQIREYSDWKVFDIHLLQSLNNPWEFSRQEKDTIAKTFFLGHPEKMIYPYPRFKELLEKQNISESWSNQDFIDLQVWSNLVWFSPLSYSEKIKYYFDKGRNFTINEKQELLTVQKEVIRQILPLYKKYQQDGKIEITFSPYYHPILPLLYDSKVGKDADPQLSLPQPGFNFPEDISYQTLSCQKLMQEIFGRSPSGMWPSEGAVSLEIVPVLADLKVKWIATDQEILKNSLERHKNIKWDKRLIYKPYQIEFDHQKLILIFRDRELSDKIGFVYSGRDTQTAVNDFIQSLYSIYKSLPEEDISSFLVTIILDGENCWEYYPRNGVDFLKGIYGALSQNEFIETTTISEFLNQYPNFPGLSYLSCGSWINSNFNIWIGHPEDNLAWKLLTDIRKKIKNLPDSDARLEALKEIYIAEGSDWFWWFGDENKSSDAKRFDLLFREHLKRAYHILGLAIPKELEKPIKK